MGDLDKFKGKGGLPTAGQKPDWLKKPPKAVSSSADQIVRGATARFAIALDATGSMSGLIDMAKKAITEILKRVIAGAGRPVEIMLVAYRDYDVPQEVVEASKLTGDANALIAWLNRIDAHGGGANDGEAVERALATIIDAASFDAIVMAGDEPANSAAFLREKKGKGAATAEDLARRLGQAKTPVHTFVVGDDPRTVSSFASIATLSGGKSGKLDGSNAMIDMAVMAMLAKLKGSEGVRTYMSHYHVTSHAADYGKLLLEGPRK
ncbi:MAG TPA: vWA domain-containing protein [Pseudolabrys sp.]|nr:vWA domain-containing protein [Pseudolabrys sp.]